MLKTVTLTPDQALAFDELVKRGGKLTPLQEQIKALDPLAYVTREEVPRDPRLPEPSVKVPLVMTPDDRFAVSLPDGTIGGLEPDPEGRPRIKSRLT